MTFDLLDVLHSLHRNRPLLTLQVAGILRSAAVAAGHSLPSDDQVRNALLFLRSQGRVNVRTDHVGRCRWTLARDLSEVANA